MKMVKSLLLASAAGLVATAGAQAADLPVKAKAVEYVKICSLYGIGFYYIPGTDTCIRIGGHLRSEYGFGNNVGVQNWGSNQVLQDRASDYIYARQRVFMHTDVRTQTEYGTLRTYSVIRWEYSTPVGALPATQTLGLDIAFIQWGGFLIGRAPDSAYTMPWNYSETYNASGTLGNADWAGGRFVSQYTYQFGNGVSGTLSLEQAKTDSQRTVYNGGFVIGSTNLAGAVVTAANINASNAALGLAATGLNGTPGSSGANSQGGTRAPDIVGQLRVDQAWGTFQVAAAAHEVHALYYGATEPTNHPTDKWGGAATAGIKVNVPTGTGDFVTLDGSWALGSTSYTYSFNGGLSANPAMFAYNNAAPGAYQSINFGYVYDAVYAAGGNLELTTSWGARAGFVHNWNPQWQSSLYGGYERFQYNANAKNIICNSSIAGVGAPAANTTLQSRLSGVCNPDYAIALVGSRTVWTPVRDFTIGAEVLASFHHSWNNGQTYTGTVADAFKPLATYSIKDNAIVSGLVTVRRYF
jgi:hypothetical protein